MFGIAKLIIAVSLVSVTPAHTETLSESTVVATFSCGTLSTEELLLYNTVNFGMAMPNLQESRESKQLVVENWIRDAVRDVWIAEEVATSSGSLDGISAHVRDVEARFLNAILWNHLLRQHLNLQEEVVLARYTEEAHRFIIPETLRFQHIFTNAGDTENSRQAAYRRIVEAFNEVRAGVAFADIAQKYSDAKGKFAGPAEVIEAPKGVLNTVVENSLLLLNQNEVSEIVETRFGYEIFKLIEIVPEEQIPFNDARETIESEMIAEQWPRARQLLRSQVEREVPLMLHFENLLHEPPSSLPVFETGTVALTVADYHLLNGREFCPFQIPAATDETRLREWAEIYQAAEYVRHMGDAESHYVAPRLKAIRIRATADYVIQSSAAHHCSSPDESRMLEYYADYVSRTANVTMRSGWRIGLDVPEWDVLDPPGRHLALKRIQEDALAIRERAIAGERFEELARAHSTLSDASSGGYLPPAMSHGALFDIHTESLSDGEIAEPVVSQGRRVLLFKLEAHHPVPTAGIEEIRGDLERRWSDECLKQVSESWTQRAVEESHLVIHRDAITEWLRGVRLDPDSRTLSPP